MWSGEGFRCARREEIIFTYHTASIHMMTCSYPRKVKTELRNLFFLEALLRISCSDLPNLEE